MSGKIYGRAPLWQLMLMTLPCGEPPTSGDLRKPDLGKNSPEDFPIRDQLCRTLAWGQGFMLAASKTVFMLTVTKRIFVKRLEFSFSADTCWEAVWSSWPSFGSGTAWRTRSSARMGRGKQSSSTCQPSSRTYIQPLRRWLSHLYRWVGIRRSQQKSRALHWTNEHLVLVQDLT